MKDTAVTAAQMKELERAADGAGLSYRQMMENAGYSAFKTICSCCPKRENAVVFAGKGNNGGDGFVVARLLAEDGAKVRVILCEGAPVTEDAIWNYERMTDIEIWPIDEIEAAQEQEILASDLIVDALYGTGFHGALRPNGRHAAQMMNRAAGMVCALDLPSGMNADSGEIAPGAVRADLTVTFHARKQGQTVSAAEMQCGKIVVADIGISAALAGKL
ncbi:MAG: NAD(P)H-hydrate epimerase [Butyricicoccus sp.]